MEVVRFFIQFTTQIESLLTKMDDFSEFKNLTDLYNWFGSSFFSVELNFRSSLVANVRLLMVLNLNNF